MGDGLLAACRVGWLVSLAGCNAIFGLDPAGVDASTDGVSDAGIDGARPDGDVDAEPDGSTECAWQTSNVDACALISGGGGGGGGGLGTIRINGTIGGTASLSTPSYTTGP